VKKMPKRSRCVWCRKLAPVESLDAEKVCSDCRKQMTLDDVREYLLHEFYSTEDGETFHRFYPYSSVTYTVTLGEEDISVTRVMCASCFKDRENSSYTIPYVFGKVRALTCGW
jgi:hypothetical protein